jgi:hypothetical protein
MKNRIPLFEDVNLNNLEVAKVVGLALKEAAVLTHFFHLASTNYNEHKVLNDFYDEINDLFDEFVEQYQGKYETIIFDGSINIVYTDAYSYIKSLSNFIESAKESFTESSIEDVLISVIKCTNKTLYLLNINKDI